MLPSDSATSAPFFHSSPIIFTYNAKEVEYLKAGKGIRSGNLQAFYEELERALLLRNCPCLARHHQQLSAVKSVLFVLQRAISSILGVNSLAVLQLIKNHIQLNVPARHQYNLYQSNNPFELALHMDSTSSSLQTRELIRIASNATARSSYNHHLPSLPW